MAGLSGRQAISQHLWDLAASVPTRELRGDEPRLRPGAERSVVNVEGGGPAAGSSLLHALVMGVDKEPRPLERAEIEGFGDFFTRHLILEGVAPLTLASLVAALDALPEDIRLTRREMFVVAEGAAFAPETPAFDVNTR